MSGYRSNKTCEEIDAILDNAVLQGSAEDTADTNTMAGLRKYVAEQSASSLIMAGTITSAFTILDGVTVGAVVKITRDFAQKYKVDTITKRRFVIVDKRVAPEEGDTLYIYPQDYPGCYFVMGDFEGNETIFDLGAIKGDWVISQERVWVKIATTKRDIAGIEGDVTADALVKRLSTQSSDNANPVATKSDIKGMVKSVTVNNKAYYSDAKGNVSLPKIPVEVDIANMGFTKNEGTVTGVMVNGESKLPNSAGVVDLGDIEVDEVKFANDLTGVIEATPEMFTFRPSAGEKSVRDESAVIRRIKGNTSVWNRQGGIKGGSIGSLTGSTVGEFAYPTTFISGHKYLAISNLIDKTNQDPGARLDIFTRVNNTSVVLQKLILTDVNYKIFTSPYNAVSGPSGKDGNAWLFCVYRTTIDKLDIYDLTLMFGAGNEPTTYEEFRALYPKKDYPYSAPIVRAMRVTGIETIGFNAYNGEYAEVIGGQAYYLGGAITTAHFATELGSEMTEIVIPESRLYTPAENGYIYATGSNICINLSHSGVRDGEYKPYEKNTLLLPEIAKYFPDGMHGIGDVYDEINEENAVKRFGVVDLGTLSWVAASGAQGGKRWASSSLGRLIKPATNSSSKINAVCSKYEIGTAENTYLGNLNCIAGSIGLNIFLYDSNLDAATTSVADFTSAISGVLLYYELAEPIYTPIDEPLQLDYKVDDFGTERMLCDEPSSPFKADIVYQFNAEGRIRDNSRNIERLEAQVRKVDSKIVQSDWLEDNPSSPAYIKNKPTLPTQVATATEVIVEYGIPAQMLPNVVYESAKSIENFTFPQLVPGEENVRNVWKLIAYMAPGTVISYPSKIKWRDGIPPTIDALAFVELTFTSMTMQNDILGEWKLYK